MANSELTERREGDCSDEGHFGRKLARGSAGAVVSVMASAVTRIRSFRRRGGGERGRWRASGVSGG